MVESGWKLQWVTLDLGRQAAILRRDVITGVVHFDGFIIFAGNFDREGVEIFTLIFPYSLTWGCFDAGDVSFEKDLKAASHVWLMSLA